MGQLLVTLKKSLIGQQWRNRRVVNSMGLRKIDQSRVLPDNDSIRGMIRKVSHLVTAEPIDEAAASATSGGAAETSA
jgi:large subunit ribosomal protein L30